MRVARVFFLFWSLIYAILASLLKVSQRKKPSELLGLVCHVLSLAISWYLLQSSVFYWLPPCLVVKQATLFWHIFWTIQILHSAVYAQHFNLWNRCGCGCFFSVYKHLCYDWVCYWRSVDVIGRMMSVCYVRFPAKVNSRFVVGWKWRNSPQRIPASPVPRNWGTWLVSMGIMGWWLDLMILVVFSNRNECMVLWMESWPSAGSASCKENAWNMSEASKKTWRKKRMYPIPINVCSSVSPAEWSKWALKEPVM